MVDFVILAVLALILGGAGLYVYRAKKRGRKCIGCPEASCPHRRTGGCGGGR